MQIYCLFTRLHVYSFSRNEPTFVIYGDRLHRPDLEESSILDSSRRISSSASFPSPARGLNRGGSLLDIHSRDTARSSHIYIYIYMILIIMIVKSPTSSDSFYKLLVYFLFEIGKWWLGVDTLSKSALFSIRLDFIFWHWIFFLSHLFEPFLHKKRKIDLSISSERYQKLPRKAITFFLLVSRFYLFSSTSLVDILTFVSCRLQSFVSHRGDKQSTRKLVRLSLQKY